MIVLHEKDLEGVFLLIVRADAKTRRHLPIVRRHFVSVQNLCRVLHERNVDIYYSGVLIARKEKLKSKIVMQKDFQQKFSKEQHVFEVQ